MSRPKTRYVLGQLHNHLNALIAYVEVILNVVIGDRCLFVGGDRG